VISCALKFEPHSESRCAVMVDVTSQFLDAVLRQAQSQNLSEVRLMDES
jgi:hypothetical protein